MRRAAALGYLLALALPGPAAWAGEPELVSTERQTHLLELYSSGGCWAAGENSGRTLRHEFVVLSFQERRLEGRFGRLTGEIEVDLKTDVPARSRSFAAWVSPGDSLKPTQAVGRELPPASQ